MYKPNSPPFLSKPLGRRLNRTRPKTNHSGSNFKSNIGSNSTNSPMWQLVNEERGKLSNLASYSFYE